MRTRLIFFILISLYRWPEFLFPLPASDLGVDPRLPAAGAGPPSRAPQAPHSHLASAASPSVRVPGSPAFPGVNGPLRSGHVTRRLGTVDAMTPALSPGPLVPSSVPWPPPRCKPRRLSPVLTLLQPAPAPCSALPFWPWIQPVTWGERGRVMVFTCYRQRH